MAAANHAYYYDNIFAPYNHQLHYHHQNAAIFVYAPIYSQYWVPLYLQYQQPQPYMPCDESWILNNQEEEEDEETVLNEEELREWDLLDEELVVYDSIDNDADTLSEETITKHLKTTTDHHHNHPLNADDQICVVCQDCLFQEQIATLDCGHDFHVGCIKNWLMVKNCCPLCKATAIQL